jgi:hypothetical protein
MIQTLWAYVWKKTLEQESERSLVEYEVNGSSSTFTGLFGAVNEVNTSEISMLKAYRRLGVVRA